jgi:hypothetical protein
MARCLNCIHCDVCDSDRHDKERLYGDCSDFLHDDDVVEVVRCKDCKYLYCLSAIDRRFYCRHYPRGLEGINIVEENPFCSYGERKEK